MFFWKRNRYAKDIAGKVWPCVSHADGFGGIDPSENAFLLGFISASCNYLLTLFEGRSPTNLDSGLVTLRVFDHCFGGKGKQLLKVNLSYMQNYDSEHQRGSEAAMTLWALVFGMLEPEQNQSLKRIKESARTAARSEFLQSHSPFPVPEDEKGQLIVEVIARIQKEAAGGPPWDEVE